MFKKSSCWAETGSSGEMHLGKEEKTSGVLNESLSYYGFFTVLAVVWFIYKYFIKPHLFIICQ